MFKDWEVIQEIIYNIIDEMPRLMMCSVYERCRSADKGGTLTNKILLFTLYLNLDFHSFCAQIKLDLVKIELRNSVKLQCV